MEQLVRCRYKITIKFDSSFDRPLSFIAEVLEKCGHPWTRSVFAHVVQVCQGVIDSKFGRLASAENKRDDLITKTLSVLEDSIAATSPVAKVMFSVMSTLGGPRGWDRESVVSSVRDWVTGETTLFSGEGQRGEVAALLNDWMPKWVGQGVLGDARKLGFEEYSRDFMRWGTPPGCSPTQRELQYAIDNGIISDKSERVGLRTKTICGMLSVLVGDSDDLLKKSDICHATLKEETKMCVIISTPMWSYVRMCYILECLQKPAFLSSTLSRDDMMVQFTKYYSMHYVAIDASKFDHNVPKWLLKDMWTALRTALSNRFGEGNELVRLCDDLCGELDDLVIEVLGARIKYEKGLLTLCWTAGHIRPTYSTLSAP
ncbi:hypothetical protein HPB51_028417 [Rhipicephalus microplus]|uniref:Uncharacterized protein n=1 Tax=Rhipicephalus microplus TaxID=6941 RepID=A0A9J6CWX7_RHIMP|nr:hypothetical protein HPB51_028417 [Rhipicephalus microplus]